MYANATQPMLCRFICSRTHLQPPRQRVKRVLLRAIVDADDPGRAAKVVGRDGAEALLPGRVPLWAARAIEWARGDELRGTGRMLGDEDQVEGQMRNMIQMSE
jgi:hypothetical protein